MRISSLKSLLKFWQEIVFIIGLGILIGGITMNISNSFQHTINIIFYSLFVLLLSGLIGQFHWKNRILAVWLAVLLGLGSFYMILAAFSDLANMTTSDEGYLNTVLAMLLFMGLTVVAFSMPFKYYKSANNADRKTSMANQ